ncbi:YheC/YheD family protein [Paenibacillus filicis]|uniref:YheC/YheD family protein n=1 Tax=Paenibacillus gyeongsangnamensis TaxID=3388067 RepID=A0ABT4Q2U4_9BACL|nr:YheC/YheD family protein [Paenibacillus filicis]MCZ8511087.1 YheC/YheD family protein [Paenibacillus filicis]
MKRFGILQAAFPARGSKLSASSSYVPEVTWRLFHAAGKKHGMQVLFFRSEDVDFGKRRVHAWSSSSSNGLSGWKRSWHPLPDVLYENYPIGRNGFRTKALAVKQRFKRLGIPVFNPAFFNKAVLQKILSRSPIVRPYLPDAKIAVKASDVTGFLKKYGVVYLKPVNGYQGRGIIEVRQLSRDQIRVKSDKFDEKKSLLQTYSLPKFESFTGKLMKRKRYLVQRGLDLLKKGDRKIDFRVVVHRGADGKWHSAGIRPKLGKAGSMVTNSHAGGTKTLWEKLELWAHRTGAPLPGAGELEKPALAAAKYLTRFRPTLSHLGIDVAVDNRKGIYLLDFNVVPGRDLLTPAMLRRVTKLITGFARYLATKRK